MSPASGDQEGLEHVLQSVSSASNSGDHEQAAGLPEVKLWNKEVLRPFLTHEKEPLNLQEPRDCPLNSATVIGPSLEPSASGLLLLDTMILLTCVLGHSLTRDLKFSGYSNCWPAVCSASFLLWRPVCYLSDWNHDENNQLQQLFFVYDNDILMDKLIFKTASHLNMWHKKFIINDIPL